MQREILRLPKVILDLFPKWEFQCPKCLEYVDKPVSACLKCGAPFNREKWRIPPRFYRTKKAMSRYAHEVLIPNATPKMKHLLLMYFTEYLNDDFEGTSPWTQQAESKGTFTYGSTDQNKCPQAGSKCGKAVANSETNGAHYALVREEVVGQGLSEVFFRAYLRPTSNWMGNFQNRNIWVTTNGTISAWNCLIGVSAFDDSGTKKWRVRWSDDGGSGDDYITSPAPQVDTWHCVEIAYKIHATEGYQKIWIDNNTEGSPVWSRTGQDSDAKTIHSCFLGGYTSGWEDTDWIIYVDCTIIADSFIGTIQQGGTIHEIYKDAVAQASALPVPQCTFNIEKDATVQSSATKAPETTFNILKDAITQASADVLVEIISGIIEIFKDAIVQAQATFTVESTFNIEKNAVTTTDATANIKTIFDVVKNAITQVSAAPQILGIYPINVDATVQASVALQLQQTLGINKDAVVVAISTPAIQSTFNISKDVVVKVLAEVSVVKEGEVKVTKIFLMIGNLAIQLTGD